MTVPVRPVRVANLRDVLVTVAGLLAAGGGLIHFAVIGDHLEFPVVAVGFAVMGALQGACAVRLLSHPSPRVLLLAGGFHALLALIWLASRTTGLVFIAGAENSEPVGVADVIATMFSLGVMGVAVVARDLPPARPVVLPARVARRMTGVVTAGALCLGLLAVLAPHEHEHGADRHPVSTVVDGGAASHEDHVHASP